MLDYLTGLGTTQGHWKSANCVIELVVRLAQFG